MEKITISAVVDAPIQKVWDYWTLPEHITQWNQASDDWHCPEATNDLKTGGKFTSKMAAKDGSFEFVFGGTYDEVKHHELIAYTMEDGRTCHSTFKNLGESVEITTIFDAEGENPVEMQKNGWQAILNSFKNHTENN